jgi:hypothetical protein
MIVHFFQRPERSGFADNAVLMILMQTGVRDDEPFAHCPYDAITQTHGGVLLGCWAYHNRGCQGFIWLKPVRKHNGNRQNAIIAARSRFQGFLRVFELGRLGKMLKIPLAKQGRTVVKGKCSACSSTFTAMREGSEGSVADQFAKHLAHRHAAETNGGLGSSRTAD